MPTPRAPLRHWLIRLLVAVTLSLPLQAAAQQAVEESGAGAVDLDGLITTLEDPAARQLLLDQLKTLQEARSVTEAEQKPAVEVAAEALLERFSGRLDQLSESAFQVTAAVNHLPEGWQWLRSQLTEPQQRRVWVEVSRSLAFTLITGYLAFTLLTLFVRRPARRLGERPVEGALPRALLLSVLLALRLAPIVAFAGGAYLALALTDPADTARTVSVAWIAAVVLARVIQTLSQFLFAPRESGLRVLPLSDETAAYGHIWARRLNVIAVYGWFGLQTLRILGLHEPTYLLLMNLLGLALGALLLVLIAQNRRAGAQALRCGDAGDQTRTSCALRNRLAGVWHLAAGFYVVFLLGVWVLREPGGFIFLARATLLTLLTAVLAWTLLFGLKRLFRRIQRPGGGLDDRLPGLRERANRYLPWVESLFRWLIYAFAALTILQAWGMGALEWLASESGRSLGMALVRMVFIALAAVAFWSFASAWLEAYVAGLDENEGARSARTRTLVQVASNALLVVISVLAVLLILSELGINIAPLLAGAGVVGLAVGFGAQTLVKDIITGTFILMQDQMAVGDVVKVGDKAGLVEILSIRHVQLRDLSGTVHILPFSSISAVSNLTKDFSYHVFDIGVAYREDADQVMEILARIGEEMQQDEEYGPLILEPLEIFGLDRFGDSAIMIKGRIKTPPIKQWMVGREFNRRVKRRFDELGVEIPFPHRTLYFGMDKAGDAPPMRVRMGDEQLLQLASEQDGAAQAPRVSDHPDPEAADDR